MAYEPTKGDYIKSDIRNFFKVDEDDNWLTSLLKGAGSLAGESTVNTGVNIGDTLFGDKKLKDLDGQDLEDAFYSIPALRALKIAPKTIKHMAKVAKKGGMKKGIEAGLKMMGPGKGAAARTSKSQLAAMTGLGSKKAGLLNRGLKLGAAGVVGNELLNRSTPDGNFGLDDLTGDGENKTTTDETETEETLNNQEVNLDNPDGQMAMTPQGQAQAAMQAKANSMDDMVLRGGGSGSKMMNLAKGRVQAEADRLADNIIKQNKIDERKAASRAHIQNVMADNWETSQVGRADGRAWNELDDETRQDMQKRFMANLGSPYNSSEDARQARIDKTINEFGGNYVSPDGKTGAPGQLTKEQFTEQTGLKNAGTGIVNTTLDGKGPVTTLEMGGQFDKAGGLETAKPFLSDAQQVNLERQLDRPGVFNDQFGQKQDMSKDTVRMTSDEQDYSDANFQNRNDALAYLNRGASLDEPAPETPAPATPEESEEGMNMDYLPYLSPLLLAHPATRKMGQKMLPKFKKNMKQLGDDFYDAVPIKTPGGYAPRLGNSPLKLPNKNPALPHRAPGLPHRADPNLPKGLPKPPGPVQGPQPGRIGPGGIDYRQFPGYKDPNIFHTL